MKNSESVVKPKIKKRKYLRKGCNECKRRKIKCDEASPACNNCTRLNKTCVYETKLTYQDPLTANVASHETPVKEKNLNLKFYKPKTPKLAKLEEPAKKENVQKQQFAFHDSPDAASANFMKVESMQTPILPVLPGITPEAAPSMVSSVETNYEMQTVFNEASLLVNDINHMLEDNVYPERNVNRFQPSPSLSSDDKTQFSIEDFVDLNDQMDGSPHLPWNKRLEIWEILNSQLIEECVSKNNLGEPHSGYLRTLTSTELSYHMYPLASLIETNEVVKLLLMYLSECPHLLFSLLAISATFQFNQTGKTSHDIARQKYIGVCLRKLSDDFSEKPASRRSQSFHVEKLLMTVLVLTTYFSAKTSLLNDTVLNSWKVHLRGARDLLINYSRITKSTESVSLGLALAKSWFFALEAVAAVFSSVGGATSRSLDNPTIDNDDVFGAYPNLAFDSNSVFVDSGFFEYHENKFYHESLTKLAMVVTSPTLSDFHIFWGYTATLVKAIVCYTRVKEAMAIKNLERAPMRWVAQIISLLGQTGREEIVPGVLPRNYQIPKTCKGHPEFEPVLQRYNFPPACYAVDTDENGEKTYYSWFDALNQFHVDFIHLLLLVSPEFYALPRTHYYVQEMVQRVFTGAFFIKKKLTPLYEKDKPHIIVESDNYYVALPTFDNRCFMIQLAFRLCASIIVEEDYFERIELFFMGLVKLGNGSSLYALDQVTRIKAIRQERLREDPDFVDEEVIEFEEGKVSIPFA